MGDIDISKIKQSKNIRHKVPDKEELAKSIQQKGLLRPILVRTLDGYFEIVAGNRRFCVKSFGMEKDRLSHNKVSPLDEANAFKAYVSEFGWVEVSDPASKIGKSLCYITKRIKLLNLPQDVVDSIMNHRLDPSVGNLIADRQLSLRMTRKLLKDVDETDDFNSLYENDLKGLLINQ